MRAASPPPSWPTLPASTSCTTTATCRWSDAMFLPTSASCRPGMTRAASASRICGSATARSVRPPMPASAPAASTLRPGPCARPSAPLRCAATGVMSPRHSRRIRWFLYRSSCWTTTAALCLPCPVCRPTWCTTSSTMWGCSTRRRLRRASGLRAAWSCMWPVASSLPKALQRSCGCCCHACRRTGKCRFTGMAPIVPHWPRWAMGG